MWCAQFFPPNPQRGLRGEQFSPGPPTIKTGREKCETVPGIARNDVPDRREWGAKPNGLARNGKSWVRPEGFCYERVNLLTGGLR